MLVVIFVLVAPFIRYSRDAVEALSAEIKALLTGPLKGKRTGVGELRKKMEAQSDTQVSALELFELRCGSLRFLLGLSRPCCLHKKIGVTFLVQPARDHML